MDVKGGKSRKGHGGKRAKLSNGISNGGTALEEGEVDEEEEEDETEEERQTKDEQISQLKLENDRLYHYAIDQIFMSAMSGQP